MTLVASSRSVPGTLRQDVLIDGRHRLTTDEPERLGGEGAGPAPHELLPAAFAACVSTTLVMYARTKGWELGEVQVDVAYDQHTTPRTVEIDVSIGADLDLEQRARLAQVAAACPIRKAVSTGFEFVERFAWGSGSELPVAA